MERKTFLKSLFLIPFISQAKASDPEKYRGDLKAIGDGKTDDSKAFQEYLSKNDVLNLPAGRVFKIGNVVLNGKTIRGPGKIQINVGANSAFTLEGNNNRIENVEFISSGKGQRPESEILLGKSLEYAVITGCVFSGNLFNAVGSNMNETKDLVYSNLPWRSKLIISQCQFKGSYAHHLYFHKLENVIVESNFFEKSKLDSIRLRQWVRKINISNNIFKDIGSSSSTDSKDAIDCFWSGLELNIQGNQFENISTHGLDIKGYSPDQDYGTSRVIISGNQFKKAGFSGILISSGSKTDKGWKAIKYVTVSHNHFENCGYATTNPNDAAIFMRHNQENIIIEGNQIVENKQKGIMLGNFEPDATNSRNILINANILTANGSTGIHISGGENVVVSNNIVDRKEKGIVAESYRNFKLINYKASNNIGE